MDISILKKIGFPEKYARVYVTLLQLGPSSVRRLAEEAELNRGTTYDALKWLQDEGVVSFYEQDKKQFFVAEHPEKLHTLVQKQEEELRQADRQLDRMIPELTAIYDRGGERPVARYYHDGDVKEILEDVLEVCEQTGEKMYRIYSTAGIREYLYHNFPTFSDARVAKGVQVKAIAIGTGGELRGLDERKWLSINQETPTYILMYNGKTAYISLNAKKELVGVVIENDGVYETQKNIFDALWSKL